MMAVKTANAEQAVKAEEQADTGAVPLGGKAVQAVVLAVTVHLAAEVFGKDEAGRAAFYSALSVAAAYGAAAAAGRVPAFNAVYVVYLPVMVSLLFRRELVPVNCAMALGGMQMPVVLRVLQQLTILYLQPAARGRGLRDVAALAVHQAVWWALARVSELRSLDMVDCGLLSILLTNVLFVIGGESSVQFQILRACLYGFLVAVGANYVFVRAYGRRNQYVRTAVLLAVFALVFPSVILAFLDLDDTDNALVWLIKYIFSSALRMQIMAGWLVFLGVLIPSVFVMKSHLSLNTSRKIWHFALLPLLVCQMAVEPEFTTVAIAGTVVVFLIVEYFRYMNLYPFGDYINAQLRTFTDFRDEQGPIIVSYLYLILGVSFPLLINRSLVGVISLGVGDSLASIIGRRYGKYHWPGTNKTVEGTLAFIVASAALCLVCQQAFLAFEGVATRNIILACVVSGILEGNSDLNDNILIPSFMLIFMELCKYY
ncbi:ABR051Cp [Eremothecium gossypii ATCC 10895]|uniref:dolichol kinase n=1 Tax=Eremothecium gossypii (strain ATCC 10895 / CBS 109.51 / FGSC 9923 / NRRL Y-1056) TaxID=284811 RepID=Q75DH5_EREGS|nr:ABR051Cp [Eremothecium gossypii ATCC 10895]AAS50821.2 ABR051Cp [Eremothecium gossypii ATCC 10895]AEY95110.1 FABR051Cp [Eremothecium gossypii FDAG1]